MTHNQWEHGETLTIQNATKEQLKWMVKDKQSTINRLYEELQKEKEEGKKIYDYFINLVSFISANFGKETLSQALKGESDFRRF